MELIAVFAIIAIILTIYIIFDNSEKNEIKESNTDSEETELQKINEKLNTIDKKITFMFVITVIVVTIWICTIALIITSGITTVNIINKVLQPF